MFQYFGLFEFSLLLCVAGNLQIVNTDLCVVSAAQNSTARRRKVNRFAGDDVVTENNLNLDFVFKKLICAQTFDLSAVLLTIG